MTVYADVLRYRELLGNLFRRDLQAKYRGSVLGVLWTVANPVVLMGVYLLVFGVVWKSPFAQGGHYPLFLLTGLAPWTFFAAAFQSSTMEFWHACDCVGGQREWALDGSIQDGKGQPEQANPVSHGCPPSRFKQLTILNTGAK